MNFMWKYDFAIIRKKTGIFQGYVYGVQLQCRLYWFQTQKFNFTATRKAQVELKYLSGFIVMLFTLMRCQ